MSSPIFDCVYGPLRALFFESFSPTGDPRHEESAALVAEASGADMSGKLSCVRLRDGSFHAKVGLAYMLGAATRFSTSMGTEAGPAYQIQTGNAFGRPGLVLSAGLRDGHCRVGWEQHGERAAVSCMLGRPADPRRPWGVQVAGAAVQTAGHYLRLAAGKVEDDTAEGRLRASAAWGLVHRRLGTLWAVEVTGRWNRSGGASVVVHGASAHRFNWPLPTTIGLQVVNSEGTQVDWFVSTGGPKLSLSTRLSVTQQFGAICALATQLTEGVRGTFVLQYGPRRSGREIHGASGLRGGFHLSTHDSDDDDCSTRLPELGLPKRPAIPLADA